MQETWVRSLGWEDSLEKELATHSSILAWRRIFHGQKILAGYHPWGCKELDKTEQPAYIPPEAVVKDPPANARDTEDLGSIPESGRSPGGGNGNPL